MDPLFVKYFGKLEAAAKIYNLTYNGQLPKLMIATARWMKPAQPVEPKY